MLIDHVGAVLFPGEMTFRYIGRIAFPIFCFLLVEGFHHTRDVKKYLMRLAGFALISEIPYDLAFRNTLFEIEHQNVFFTLFLGVFLMHMLEKYTEITVKTAWIILVMWASTALACDYTYKGILLILVYYFLRDFKAGAASFGALWNFAWGNSTQYYGAFSSIFIAFYNGKKGKGIKYFFYIFYPVHLLILYGINVIF